MEEFLVFYRDAHGIEVVMVDWMVPDLDKVVNDLEEKGFKPRTPIWTFKFQGLVESRQVLYFDPGGVTVHEWRADVQSMVRISDWMPVAE